VPVPVPVRVIVPPLAKTFASFSILMPFWLVPFEVPVMVILPPDVEATVNTDFRAIPEPWAETPTKSIFPVLVCRDDVPPL